MTRERDFDQLIRTFIEEGPEELSPRLFASIRDDVHGTRQRARVRPWRTLSMPRPILIFAALGAILVASGAMYFAGFGGRGTNVPTPVPSPVSSASPTPTPLFTPAPTYTPYPLSDGDPWIVMSAASGGALLVRADGTDSHQILRGLPVTVQVPNWSPDGGQIVFEGNGDRGSQIWLANADGSAPRQLTPTPDGCPDGTCTEGVQPAMSPDGRSIVFVAPTHVAGSLTKVALVVLDIATGATTELVSRTDMSFARPSWSPDSKRVVVEIDRFEGTPEVTKLASTVLAVVRIDGADHAPKEITEADALAGFATWHPTDDLIVFRSNRFDPDSRAMQNDKAASNLFTVRSDGTGLTAITDNPKGVIVRAPTWTPDGRIMYSKLADMDSPELLHVINADGTGDGSATPGVETEGEGRWRPTS